MEVFHDFPFQDLIELGQNIESNVAKEDNEVEILWAKRTVVVLLEDTVPQVQLIAVFAIKFKEWHHENNGAKKAANIRESFIYFLIGSVGLKIAGTLPEVEFEVFIPRVNDIILINCSLSGLQP